VRFEIALRTQLAGHYVRRAPQDLPEVTSRFPSFFSMNPPPTMPIDATNFQNKPKGKPLKKGEMYFYVSDPSSKLNDNNNTFIGVNHGTYIYLAEHYKFEEKGKSFAELCEHNAQQAGFVKQFQIAQVWLSLKLFFQNSPETSKHRKDLKVSVDRMTTTEEESRSSSPTPSITSFAEEDIPDGFTNKYSFEFLNESVSTGPDSDNEAPFDFHNIPYDEDYEHFNFRAVTPKEDELLSSDISFPLIPLPMNSSPLIGRSNFFQPLEFKEPVPPKEKKFTVLFNDELDWNPTHFVKETLEFYAENGDVQTAVTMAIVLGKRILLDQQKLRHWFLSYIDLLHRFQLWIVANAIIRKSEDDSIRTVNKASTSIHTNCPKCNKPLMELGWVCDHCKRATNTCSLCHQRVKGLYVWCQECGHGGHADHFAAWFKTESHCPAGCGHICSMANRPRILKQAEPQDSLD